MSKRAIPQTVAVKYATDDTSCALDAAQVVTADIMSIEEIMPGAWSGFAVTKFRPPKRHDLVSRPILLQRAREAARKYRVCLICAPAGFGKSTLLLQLFNALGTASLELEPIRCVWLSLDEHDNDINRLLISLLGALRDLVLTWEVSPGVLASQVNTAGPQSQMAVAAIVNALATYSGQRLVLIVDDLHRVTDEDALGMLGEIMDQLPSEVGAVIGTRTEPAIPVARWRARGELGEFLATDLKFTSNEILALAHLLQSRELSTDDVRDMLQRTEGWAAGLQLMLASTSGQPGLPAATHGSAQRHLFDFFAQEVIADLPADLRSFLLHCAILPELTPLLCNAVMERNDSRAILMALYRRDLFLTVLDEQLPVLRLHDLFADFLRAELERCHPDITIVLHARAANVETNPLRAVAHWLKAEQWDAAIGLMLQCADSLLAQGSTATLLRWLGQLPADIARANADVAYLQALCALGYWHFADAAVYLNRAAAAHRTNGDQAALMRCLALLPRACISVGQLDLAAQALSEADALPMPLQLRVICDGARAWLAAARAPQDCAAALSALADSASLDPGLLLPAIDDLCNPFMTALPGTLPQIARLQSLCRRQLAAGVMHWQLEALADVPWPELWRGERSEVEAAFDRHVRMMSRLAIVPILTIIDNGLNAALAAFLGDFPRALSRHEENLRIITAMNEFQTWRRSTIGLLAHFHWMGGDLAGLLALWPEMAEPRMPFEWPMVATCRALMSGRIAVLAGRFDDAELALLEAVNLQTTGRMVPWYGDARCSLAYCYLLRQDKARAQQVFLPVFEEMLAEDCIGPLLIESRRNREGLLSVLPPALMATSGARALIARLASWHSRDDADAIGINDDLSSPTKLSKRECEVLARLAAGDSNKQIARAFDLSLHTVKRHVANILVKLDCSTRGQAAARCAALPTRQDEVAS